MPQVLTNIDVDRLGLLELLAFLFTSLRRDFNGSFANLDSGRHDVKIDVLNDLVF